MGVISISANTISDPPIPHIHQWQGGLQGRILTLGGFFAVNKLFSFYASAIPSFF